MNLKIDSRSGVPLHIQAESVIRQLIAEEEYQNGKVLPNEVELSQQLNISRNTLRQAINRLVNEGLLVRKKKKGTTVSQKKVFSAASNWLSFSQEMKVMGIEVQNYEMRVSRQKVSQEINTFFESLPDEKLLVLERLRGKKEFPFVYFESVFSPKILFTGSENFNRPLYEILQDDFGITVETSNEQIYAEAANEFVATKLEIEIGEPILVRKRFVYDNQNQPIEYNIGYYRADSFTYTITCKR